MDLLFILKETFLELKALGLLRGIFESEFSKVKFLSIDPGQMLSMQMHEHRSETWYVTQGIATVTKDELTFVLHPGEIVIDNERKT